MAAEVDVAQPPGHQWYLAIGSMMNPVSLKLRGLEPVRSYPARVPDWELVFVGAGGMASLQQTDGAFMHGVQ